jgi:hypothetical protein
MFRSLRARLTLGYLAFVMVLFVVVAVVYTREAMLVYARSQNETITETAAQIKEIAEAAHPHTFVTIAGAVQKLAEKPAVRIVGFEQTPGMQNMRPSFRIPPGSRGVYIRLPARGTALNSAPPAPPRQPDRDRRAFSDRLVFTVAGLAGIRPVQVPLDVATFIVSPNINRLRSVIVLYALSLGGMLLACALLGWLIGSYLARQALAPMVAVTGAL